MNSMINPLAGQFIKAMKKAYSVEDNCEEQLSEINEERMQFVLLHDLLFRLRDKTDLVELVESRLNSFHLGMNARDFILSCADEIFRAKQAKEEYKKGEDVFERMKRLHPLWGDSLMSF